MSESKPVRLPTGDGVLLGGHLTSGADAWVILWHDRGGDLDIWRPLQETLEAFTLLAMDLRGHGLSEGAFSQQAAEDDLVTTIRWARAQGAARVGVVAAGSSADSALSAAAQEPIDAVVLLSPPSSVNPGCRPRVPKLILVGGADPAALEAARAHYQRSIGPASLVDFPVHEQGPALLTTAFAAHVSEQISGFLANTLSRSYREVSTTR